MINRVNYFRIQFRFRRNIQIFIKLLGGHHAVCITPQSHEKKYLKNRNSAVCIKPWSQTAHCGVRIDIFESLSLLLKRQSGKILLWVKNLSWKKKFEEQFFDLLSLKFWLCGVMHTRVEFFELCDRLSQINRNSIWKYCTLFNVFIRGPYGFESWKKWRLKISLHTPFKNSA